LGVWDEVPWLGDIDKLLKLGIGFPVFGGGFGGVLKPLGVWDEIPWLGDTGRLFKLGMGSSVFVGGFRVSFSFYETEHQRESNTRSKHQHTLSKESRKLYNRPLALLFSVVDTSEGMMSTNWMLVS
jgi:hypothetical protein